MDNNEKTYNEYRKKYEEEQAKKMSNFEDALKKFQEGELKIVEIDEEDLNPYADVRFCNNGGGYLQYSVTYEINGCTLEYEDTSCGDFGDRYSTTFGPYSYSYDGVSGDGEYSDFPTTQEVGDFLNAIREEIHVPFYEGDR